MKYTDPQNVLDHFAQGKFIIVVCETLEKEGDFFVLAEHISAEKINFLLTEAKGMVCTACSTEVIDQFELPLMVKNPNDKFGTNFTISVDAAEGITTGVSAADRAETIKVLADPKKSAKNLVTPGHTHPLRARDPKTRWGHTECSVQMAKKVGKRPTIVICEILNEAGAKASKQELFALAEKLNLPITSLEEMKKFLLQG